MVYMNLIILDAKTGVIFAYFCQILYRNAMQIVMEKLL
jgi:hypothetical protein